MKYLKSKLMVAATLFMAQSAFAQVNESLTFVKGNGELIPNGSEMILTEADELGMVKLDAFVKNNTEEGAYFTIECKVDEITDGIHQICYSGQCYPHTVKGTYEIQPPYGVAPGERVDLQAEWTPFAVGTCKITYKINLYQMIGIGIFDLLDENSDGPSMTVIYSNDPSGIKNVDANNGKTEYFDLYGRKAVNPVNGVFIKKTTGNNGKVATTKVVLK